MPAIKHTRKANTPKRARQWDDVRRSAESRGASAGSAIRQANAAVKRSYGRSKKRGRR